VDVKTRSPKPERGRAQSDDRPLARSAADPAGRGARDQPQSVSAADLALMRRLNERHLEIPFADRRMLRGRRPAQGFTIRRLHVATLMKRMGIEALYRKANTSKAAPGHQVYSYLLPALAIARPNQD